VQRLRHGLAAGAATLALALLLAACGGTAETTSGGGPNGAFDGDRAFADLRAQVDLGPRPAGSRANAEQADMLAARLEQAGAENVRVQSPLRNVVGTIPGTEPGYIVVGAHHDTDDIPGFVGANDGASGVAVALELARSLPNPFPGPSIAIALFDGEEARGDRDFSEDGSRGSRQYVDYAAGGADGSPPLKEIEAMVLFDMVGDCDLAIPMEAHSDPALYAAFAEADGKVFSSTTFPVDDDHTPFLDRGIPAVDLIDFDYGPGPPPGEWWHTDEDTVDKVCPESLDAVGEAALKALPEIAAAGRSRQ
jgi:Zn-dependent M28 family amino/carboxypeptidase